MLLNEGNLPPSFLVDSSIDFSLANFLKLSQEPSFFNSSMIASASSFLDTKICATVIVGS